MAAATSRSLVPPALRRGSPSAPATRPSSEPVHRLGCLKSRPLSVPSPARTSLPTTSLRVPLVPAAAINNADLADDTDRGRSPGEAKGSASAGHWQKAVIIATAPLGALLLTSGPASAFSGSHAHGGLGQGELGWSESLGTNAGGGGGSGSGNGDGGGGGGGGGEGGGGGAAQRPGDSSPYSNADLEDDDDDVDEADNPGGISEPVSPVSKSATGVRASAADAVASNTSGSSKGGRDAAAREFPKRRSSSRRRHGASGSGGGGGATLLNSYPPDVLFASLSAVASSAGRAGTGGDESAAPGSGGGGSSSSAGGSSSGMISSRRRRPDDERMRRADGMFDWMAGLLHSLLASRLDGMQDRVDRQALMAETADLVVQILDKRSADDAFAHRSEVSALRRLQREAFQDLLRVKDRLHRLEFLSGVRQSPDSRSAGSAYSASATAFGASAGAFGAGIAGIGEESGVWGGLGAGAGSVLGGGGRTRLHGEIAAGGAFVPTEGARSHGTRAALEQAGMRSGLTVKFRFDTTCRDDDLLSTELTAGLGEDSSSFMLGGPVNVHKILYSTKLCDGLQLAVAPLGAVGSDMAEGMNPLKDQGLTRFSSGGISLHRRARGSALALSLRNSSASFTAAQFLSGWGVSQDPEGESAGLCASSLAQLSLQPQDNIVLSMSALNRLWPSPPLPSATGLHWSEMGPLVVPKLLPWLGKPKKTGSGRGAGSGDGSSATGGAESSSGVVGQELWLPPDQEPATMVQSVAVSGAAQLGPATIAAWAQAENGDCLDEDARRKLQWSVSLLLQGKGGEEDEGKNGGGTGGSSANGAGGKAGAGKAGRKGKWTDRISLGACIGGTQPDAFFLGGGAESSSTGMVQGESGEGNEGGGAGTGAGQVQAEAFLRVKCGRGLVLQPGVVVAENERSGRHTAFMLRTSWAL
ncbi:hypothetical protein CLOM_g11909 [Closterium sp. NIES-68]|nr:hypothetical protein CLOM_g11909 [Closterium sp. NIES-68]GJP82594.1 hypothetical protein CLOP_g12834 [Closterium sp. NIES-67]